MRPTALPLLPLEGAPPEGAPRRSFRVLVPDDLLYFQGHFEGDPVLPGVVQLSSVVLRAVALAWPDLPPLRHVTRLKLRHPIRPGASLVLALSRSPGRGRAVRVGFELRGEPETVYASGSLDFDALPGGA